VLQPYEGNNVTNRIIPFSFESHAVRVQVGEDGQSWFNANDVCEVLEFANPRQAVESHVDPDDVQKLDTLTTGGRQRQNHVNESGLYALVLGSTKDAAKRFKRWVTGEVLPAIRKTGSYVGARPAIPDKVQGELAIMECFTRLLCPAPSSQVAMLEKIAQQNGLESQFLPAYVVDAPTGSDAESALATASISKLLKDCGIRTSAGAYNTLLRDAGVLEDRTRASRSSPTGEKHFWSVTEKGLQYGKNLTSPSNPRETQPHWYIERFSELHRIVTGQLI
jgi:prophage antirepressor-like protein